MKTQRGGGPETFKTFARNCLLARRMVERGVRFVGIHHASWDHHNDLDNDLTFNCRVTDQPVGALLNDLKQRGLLDEPSWFGPANSAGRPSVKIVPASR